VKHYFSSDVCLLVLVEGPQFSSERGKTLNAKLFYKVENWGQKEEIGCVELILDYMSSSLSLTSFKKKIIAGKLEAKRDIKSISLLLVRCDFFFVNSMCGVITSKANLNINRFKILVSSARRICCNFCVTRRAA